MLSDQNRQKLLLRFADLKQRGIVTSWPQLKRLQDGAGFPAGYLLGPSTRVWDAPDIEAWLQSRRDATKGVQHQ